VLPFEACPAIYRLVDSASLLEDASSEADLLQNLNMAILHGINSSRDRVIVRQRLAGLTLVQIGHGYGITRERVRQIGDNALTAIRKRLSQYLNRDKPKQSRRARTSMATEDAELLAEGISIEPGLMQVIEKYAYKVQDRNVLHYILDRNGPASHGHIAITLNIDPSRINSIVNQFVSSIRMLIAVYEGKNDKEQEAEQLSYWLGVITERVNAVPQGKSDDA
jgi:Sigma-70, region 4